MPFEEIVAAGGFQDEDGNWVGCVAPEEQTRIFHEEVQPLLEKVIEICAKAGIAYSTVFVHGCDPRNPRSGLQSDSCVFNGSKLGHPYMVSAAHALTSGAWKQDPWQFISELVTMDSLFWARAKVHAGLDGVDQMSKAPVEIRKVLGQVPTGMLEMMLTDDWRPPALLALIERRKAREGAKEGEEGEVDE